MSRIVPLPLFGLLVFSSSLALASGDSEAPSITHVRVAKAPQGQRLRVRAKIDDASEVFAPSLYYRAKGEADFTSVEMQQDGDAYEAIIPGEKTGADFEYFIEAFDEHGNGPAREGSPEAPIVVSVFDPSTLPPELRPKDELTPDDPDHSDDGGVASKWWFWTLIGAAVVGGTTAAIVAATSGGPSAVDVLVQGPDPSRGLQ